MTALPRRLCVSDGRVGCLQRVRGRVARACEDDMKRPLLIIAIFLLLGAVVNVAVAWTAPSTCWT